MADCRLMLNFNGADGDTATVDATGRHPIITFGGTAQISTTNPKFGTGCLLLDGDSDGLDIPASADWNIAAVAGETWCVEAMVKHVDHVGTEDYLSQYADANNRWIFRHAHGSGLSFQLILNGVTILTLTGSEIADTLYHHVLFVRMADEYALYLDGQQCAYLQDSSLGTIAGNLHIGYSGAGGNYFDGRLDRLRIDKSNHFGAAPNVGLTDVLDIVNTVAHYELYDDAANTTVLDSSGNAFNGTLAGGDNTEDISIPGPIESAFDFNGTDDYVDTGETFDAIFQGSFSGSILMRPDDGQPASLQTVWGSQVADTDLAKLYLNTDGRLAFNYKSDDNGITMLTTSPVFADGAATSWTHVMWVADSTIGGAGGLKVYVNGVLAGSGSTAGITFADFVSALNIYIGGLNLSGLNSPFAGGLANFALFSQALTAAQVLAIYTEIAAGLPGVDLEYEAWELLPEFPTLTRSPSARSWSQQPAGEGVASSGLASGYPLVAENYTFTPVNFQHGIEFFSETDKATLWTFYESNKGRVILWLNKQDNLKYQVIFNPKRPPKFSLAGVPDLWNVTMDLIQVNSQTVS